MASLFASASQRAATTTSACSVAASSSSSSSASPLSCIASSSSCQLAPPAAASRQRLFSTTSSANGKSRAGEGKDARRAIRRAARLGSQVKSATGVEMYTLADAFRVLKAAEIARPLNALEVHIVTSVTRNQSNALRGRIAFPHSPSIKVPTILVIASEGSAAYGAAAEAKAKGSPIILGGADIIEKVAANQVGSYDKVLASPDVMAQLSRSLARSLGPKGLMPNVKRGTVAESAAEMTSAIEEALGASDWRGDRQSVIRAAIGRINFKEEQVRDNMRAVLSSIIERVTSGLGGGTSASARIASGMPSSTAIKIAPRPEGVPAPLEVQKRAAGIIKQLHLSSTQGPGILLDLKECL